MRQLDKSIEFYTSAKKDADELNDQMGKAIILGNIGKLYDVLCVSNWLLN